MATANVPPAAPGGAGPWAVLAPRGEDGLHRYERSVREVRRIKLGALRVGDVYIVAYRDHHGEKNYVLLWPQRRKVDSYDNWAEFADTLVEVLRSGVGNRVERVEVDAVLYLIEERRVNRHEPSWRDTAMLKYVEWGAYGLLLGEEEELIVDGP